MSRAGVVALVVVACGLGAMGCAELLARDRSEEARTESEAMVAKAQAEQKASTKLEGDRFAAEEAARKDKKAAEEAAKVRAEKQRADDHDAFCARDRTQRVADAQRQLREYIAWVQSEKPRIAYFDAHCEIVDSRGIKVSRERVKDGVIIRSSAVGDERDVKCDGAPGRPKGIDAAWLSDTEDRIESVVSPGSSGSCGVSDQSALGTTLVVSCSDKEAIARVLALP